MSPTPNLIQKHTIFLDITLPFFLSYFNRQKNIKLTLKTKSVLSVSSFKRFTLIWECTSYTLISVFDTTIPCTCVPAGISACPPFIKKPNKQQRVTTTDKTTLLLPSSAKLLLLK